MPGGGGGGGGGVVLIGEGHLLGRGAYLFIGHKLLNNNRYCNSRTVTIGVR